MFRDEAVAAIAAFFSACAASRGAVTRTVDVDVLGFAAAMFVDLVEVVIVADIAVDFWAELVAAEVLVTFSIFTATFLVCKSLIAIAAIKRETILLSMARLFK